MEVQNLILSFDDLWGTACNVTILKKTSPTVLSHCTIYLVNNSNFLVLVHEV